MKTHEKIKTLLEKNEKIAVSATPFFEISYPTNEFRGFQGGCSDGKRYYYQTVMHYDLPTRERDCCRIAKIDLQTGAVVKWSDTLFLNHANDMTYHPATNCLYVCNNKPHAERISFVEADTLQLLGSYDLPFPIYAIAYNEKSDTFVVGLSGKREFCFLNGDLTPCDTRTYRTTHETDRYVKQGICTDGELLYMSNGSGEIAVRNPKNFEVVRTIPVTIGRTKASSLNELEWIGGELWANVYLTDQILRIDPATGRVVGIIDLAELQSPADRTYNTDVLNGIAHDPATGTIWLTGKNWNKVYQVEIVEK
jgi:glutamine cyclotransferase